MTMRNVFALMMLFCGAASADAHETQKWCAEDNNQAAFQLSPTTFLIEGQIVSEHTF